MSNYSHALRQIVDNVYDGNQSKLAANAKVPQSLVSRHCTGRYRPEFTIIEKICNALPPESRVKLIVAHIKDETPESAKHDFQIKTKNLPSTISKETFPAIYERLDKEAQESLTILAQDVLVNEDARELLKIITRFCRKKQITVH